MLDGVSVSNDYGFDELSQLASVAATPSGGTASTSTLAATSAGLLTRTQAGVELAYNPAQQVVSATPATGPATAFAYDAKGSRVSATTAATANDPQLVTSYEYSPSGALESVQTPTATVAYTSDGRGLRQSRTVGTTTKEFTWSTVGGLPLLLDDGEHRFIYGPSSTPLAQVDGSGETEYLSADLLGTPRLITDEDGDVGATATYDAFGALVSHIGAAVTRFGFTGNWTDPDTGLLYLRARDYDAATGQFLTVDPALDRTQQPYAYTGNNPVQRTDPTGLDWWSEAGDNVLAAGAGALSNLSMGASDAILGAMVPGYDCFIADHSDAYGIGDMMVTIVSVALMVIPGVGLVAAGLLIAKTVIRAAIKTGLRQTIKTAATSVRTSIARIVKPNQVDTPGAQLSLNYKTDWSPAQRLAADEKVAALNAAAQQGELIKTAVAGARNSLTSQFRKVNSVDRASDVDHTIDLQLGGANIWSNLRALDLSVNRSLGAQIMHQLADIPVGMAIRLVTIG